MLERVKNTKNELSSIVGPISKQKRDVLENKTDEYVDLSWVLGSSA